MCRDLVGTTLVRRSNRAEALSLGPDSIGPAPHYLFDFVREGIGSQVKITDSSGVILGPQDGVSNGATY